MRVLVIPPPPVLQLVSISGGMKVWAVVLGIHACHRFPPYTRLTVLVPQSGLFLKSGCGLNLSLLGKAA